MANATSTPPRLAGKIDGTVVKIGGSLVTDRARLCALLAECAEEPPVAIVPGGGPFADAVRATQAALGLDDALAHRLALDAMGRMAEVFCALEPRLTIATSPEAVADALAQGRSVIWDPVALKAGHAEIAESWDVTSDSLALWLASQLGVDRCILVKSAKRPVQTDPAALARAGFVDAAFPRFAAAFDGAIVIRGPEDFHQKHAA
ncbi:uridylate kinase [Methylobacterium sp. Leaf123]|uniref:amino acid kinase family protein n=1 Tax=Methylobacterium sp. Leaf123 TaxID=1736264 RepID=UPI0006F7EDC3|nr:uridylate kinase [Methylobacterium sp. Leaf123]KQQ27056.1 uridylate kinase [Methylobacterium sp. Leaf123]